MKLKEKVDKLSSDEIKKKWTNCPVMKLKEKVDKLSSDEIKRESGQIVH